MLIYNGQIIAGGGTIVLPMTRAEYEANKAILDSADVWVDLTDEPDSVATAEQIAYWVGQTQKSVGYIGDIATKALAKVEPTDTALYLHEVGEYFINKDGNACKVDIQIPVDGTITLGTNCHVLPKGVANDTSGNLPHYISNSLTYTNLNQSIGKNSSYTAPVSGWYLITIESLESSAATFYTDSDRTQPLMIGSSINVPIRQLIPLEASTTIYSRNINGNYIVLGYYA